jgi:glycine dehydrogenase subunit 1
MYDNSHYLAQKLSQIGFNRLHQGSFFMEFIIETPKPAAFYIQQLSKKGIVAGFDLSETHPRMQNSLLVCATEIFSQADLDRFVTEMGCLL